MEQPSTACIFEYLYRDAGNWKTYERLLLAGTYAPALRDELLSLLDGDQIFVAEQVGIPPLHDKHHAVYGCGCGFDHAFHEFVDLRPATEEEALAESPAGTVAGLLVAFHAANRRWNCSLSPYA